MIALADVMRLREICQTFLDTSLDELHGNMILECMIAGQIERIAQEANKIVASGKTTLPEEGDDHWNHPQGD